MIFIIAACNNKKETVHKISQYSKEIAYLKLDSTYLKITVIADSINIPWDIASGIGNFLWYTEQYGTVNLLDLSTGRKRQVLKIPDVFHKKSYGLLGFVPHPDFEAEP